LRVGCCKKAITSSIPVVSNIYTSYLDINESTPSPNLKTTTFLVNNGELLAIYLTNTSIDDRHITLSIGNTGSLKIEKVGSPTITTTYTVFAIVTQDAYSLNIPSQTMPSGYAIGDIITITLL
jgi:hypothetical protein